MVKTGYYISNDKSKLNKDLIHEFLSKKSYWAENRTFEEVETSITNSMCFGLYSVNNDLVGFARVVSDFVIYAYIMDLFIVESRRGNGLSKLLLQNILNEQNLKPVKKWALATRDAHGLYEQFGFLRVEKPERLMERIVKV